MVETNINTKEKKTDGAKPAERSRHALVVKTLLMKVEEKLSGAEMKATLGDYIRLMQLQKDLEEDEPREIRVTWIETEETESETEK